MAPPWSPAMSVLRARLADANFFWDEDRKTSLEISRLPALKALFHCQLGTVADKVARMEALAADFAEASAGRGGHRRAPRGAALQGGSDRRDGGRIPGVSRGIMVSSRQAAR